MTTTIKTTLFTFSFDTRTQAAEWNLFKESMSRPEFPRCHGPVLADVFHPFDKLNACEIELDASHLFNNQWNTTDGLRVFDYALQSDSAPHAVGMSAPRGIRRGHYLLQTDEMRAIRAHTLQCGYCGKQQSDQGAPIFCDRCIDSEYLKESELKLTRLKPVAFDGDRPELSDAEKAILVPAYHQAQLHGVTAAGIARIAKKRASLVTERDKRIRHANQEHDGFMWLLDKGLRVDNVIYYNHRGPGVFSFGWRTKLDKETTDSLLDLMSEFPFEYELVTDHRGKLSNFE